MHFIRHNTSLTEHGLPVAAVHRSLSVFLAALLAGNPGSAYAQSPATVSTDSLAAQTPVSAANASAGATPPAVPSSTDLQALLQRIQDLERREAERAQAAASDPNVSLVRTLQQRIVDLETKIQSLESSVVVPELIATPDPAPSNAELDQKIQVVDRKRELAEEQAAARSREMPQLSIGSTGFVMRSADTNFVLRIRGLIQADSRTFFDDNPLDDDNSGFLLRRARVGLEGTVFGDFDYQFNAELGDGGLGASNLQVLDANIAYRLQPNLRFRAGKFKGPVGYEQYLPVNALLFNERSLATDLAPVRDSGVQIEGEAFDALLSYAAGVFNTVGDRRNPSPSTLSDDLQYGGRFQIQPFKHSDNRWFKGLAFGAGGSYSQISSNVLGLPNPIGGTIPGYATPTLQQFFAYNSPAGTVVADGVLWRFNPHLQYVKGPFGVLGEYILNGQDVLNATTLRSAHLNHSAWQASAQWVLTGEDASFGNLTPLRPLRPLDGGWGAWQLVARLSRFDVDSQAFEGFSNPATSANSATSWSVGINWWLTRNARILTSFTHTSFDGGGTVNAIDPTTQFPPATVTHQDEQALMTRFQLSY